MILLDTHTVFWWIQNSSDLSRRAEALIAEEKERNDLVVSAISIWEILLLEKKKRLTFSRGGESWVERLAAMKEISIQPIDFAIARQSMTLADYEYGDPADRFILATAQSLAIPLITKDERMHDYKPVETIW